MQYLLMIYGREADMASAKPADIERMMHEYTAFTQDIVKSGHLKGGDRLHPSGSATTARIRDGKRLMTDGPFAETHEQLAGYYLIEAKDLDEAAMIAAKIPGAKTGSIEVRPVDVMSRKW